MTFPQKLKKIRHELDLSQEQLAEKLRVSRQAVTKWESGDGMPDTFNMKELSKLSGYSLDYLLDNNATQRASVGLFESVNYAFTHFSDFGGITGRRVFGWYGVFYVLVLAICSVFDFVKFNDSITLSHVLSSVFVIATLVPSLAIGVRRLRDAGEKWQQMFWILVPVFGFFYLCHLWMKPRVSVQKLH